MLGCVTEHLCLHLNQLTPTVSNRYIHVNMAEAGAVAAVLAVFERPDGEDFLLRSGKAEPYGDGVLAVMRWRLSSGYVGTAAQQRGMDDSGAVRMKYSLHSRPNAQQAPSCSHPAESDSSRRPLAVGTLEFHFLFLFQSLSHPSFAVVYSPVVILLTDLSSACPCLLSRRRLCL